MVKNLFKSGLRYIVTAFFAVLFMNVLIYLRYLNEPISFYQQVFILFIALVVASVLVYGATRGVKVK